MDKLRDEIIYSSFISGSIVRIRSRVGNECIVGILMLNREDKDIINILTLKTNNINDLLHIDNLERQKYNIHYYNIYFVPKKEIKALIDSIDFIIKSEQNDKIKKSYKFAYDKMNLYFDTYDKNSLECIKYGYKNYSDKKVLIFKLFMNEDNCTLKCVDKYKKLTHNDLLPAYNSSVAKRKQNQKPEIVPNPVTFQKHVVTPSPVISPRYNIPKPDVVKSVILNDKDIRKNNRYVKNNLFNSFNSFNKVNKSDENDNINAKINNIISKRLDDKRKVAENRINKFQVYDDKERERIEFMERRKMNRLKKLANVTITK